MNRPPIRICGNHLPGRERPGNPCRGVVAEVCGESPYKTCQLSATSFPKKEGPAVPCEFSGRFWRLWRWLDVKLPIDLGKTTIRVDSRMPACQTLPPICPGRRGRTRRVAPRASANSEAPVLRCDHGALARDSRRSRLWPCTSPPLMCRLRWPREQASLPERSSRFAPRCDARWHYVPYEGEADFCLDPALLHHLDMVHSADSGPEPRRHTNRIGWRC